MTKNILYEFEDSSKEKNSLKAITMLLIATLVTGFWFAIIKNYFSNSSSDLTDFYILTGASLLFGMLVYFFANNSKVGWFLLCLIITFLFGAFTGTVIYEILDLLKNINIAGYLILIIMLFNSLLLSILLFHNKTKKRLLISNSLYFTCMVVSVLLIIVGFVLVQ